MRRTLNKIGLAITYLSMFYGFTCACRAFFKTGICEGTECRWILAGLPWGVVALIFLFVFLPISPFVSLFYGWVGCLVGTLLRLAALAQFRPGQRPHLLDPDELE